MATDITSLNRNYTFIFCPKHPYLYGRMRRKKYFGVGAGKLSYYLGKSNAQAVIKRALKLKDKDKDIVKFRATGRVYIYNR